MTHNARVAALAAAVAWVGVWVTLPPAALAQAPAGYQAPRTPSGDPDLQGTWPSTDMVGVPLERLVEFGTDGRMPKITPYGAERMAMRARYSSTYDAYGFYEYACHEGNNAMRNILSGARAAERGAGSR